MNPWKIVGWIVLVILILFLATCGLFLYGVGKAGADRQVNGGASGPTASAAPAPRHTLQVVSINCSGDGRDRADITVRNVGTTTLSFAKAYVEFKDEAGKVIAANDSYFSPHDIPPGSIASADVYSSGSGAHKCGLTAVQDRDGAPATLNQ